MKKCIILFLILMFSFMMISCNSSGVNNFQSETPLDTETSNNPSNENVTKGDLYDYFVVEGTIQLVKYKGVYKSLIEIPEEIDGLVVTAIKKGCFVKEQLPKARLYKNSNENTTDEDNEESENSTYLIGDNITEIEEDSFSENSTYVTSYDSKPDGWKDDNMNGSGKEGTGNVYYSTAKDETIVSGGIVYVKDEKLGGLYVTRCLTNRKEVVIPSKVQGETVIDVGREAFLDNSKIEKVVLPETIGNVYRYAFVDCVNLKEVVFQGTIISRLMDHSFDGCTSLDVVKLPPNMTYLGPGAFSNCGTISLLYMPGTLGSISSGAFNNTKIAKIIYGGTKEQWDMINISSSDLNVLNQAEIEFADSQEHVYITRLKDIYDLETNTSVEFTGVIIGFYNQKGVYVADPTDNYSIFCYNASGLPFYDVDYIGMTVKVTGSKVFYNGQLEVYQCQVEVIDENKTYLEPTELDLSDPQLEIEDYINIYVVVKGVVSKIDAKYTYLDGCQTYLYYYYRWPESPIYTVGSSIEVIGWVYTWNQAIYINYDTRLVKVLD